MIRANRLGSPMFRHGDRAVILRYMSSGVPPVSICRTRGSGLTTWHDGSR